MTDINDWGMDFINKVDERIKGYSEDDPVKEQWMTGEWSHELTRLCREVQPDITEEQLNWVEEFLSEI